MRKTIKFLMIFLMLILLSAISAYFSTAHATTDDTVTVTYDSVATNVMEITFTWTADSNAATVTSTETTSINGYVISAITNPGTTAPTAAYDIALNDEDGIDVFGGELGDRSATASEYTRPLIETSTYGDRWVSGTLTMVLSGNSVKSATGVLKVYIYNPEIRR